MINSFVYPVSAIMKFWHLIISNFMDDSLAWILSIVMLVLTVRSFIAPFNWMSIRSGRISALMRPQNTVLDKELGGQTSVDGMVSVMRQQRDLKEEYGYNPASGCLPIFIMVPFFLGLYQTVLRMARINDLNHVGFLNKEDIENFRTAEINGVSITDYAGKHVDLIGPILIAAIIFTMLSTMISMYRGFLTLRMDDKTARRLFFFTAAFIAMVPFMLWNTAVHGPIPVAVILYWGCNYLYTLLQTVVIEVLLRRRYPLTAEVHEYRREGTTLWLKSLTWQGRKEQRAQKKERKRAKKELKRQRRAQRKPFSFKNFRFKKPTRAANNPAATAPGEEPTLTYAQMHKQAKAIIKKENQERKAARKATKSNNPPEDQKA